MTSAAPAPAPLTDQAVLEYLQRKGLGSAALELSNLLKKEKPKDTRAELEEEDYVFRNQRTLLAKVSYVNAKKPSLHNVLELMHYCFHSYSQQEEATEVIVILPGRLFNGGFLKKMSMEV